MEYKYEYKNLEERESLLNAHNDLLLIKEQNIAEGNFLTFADSQTQQENQEAQELSYRVSDISTYLLNSDETTISNIENSILEIEKNKILEGMM